MLVAKDFRTRAREALSGKWGVAIGSGLVASLLGAYTALNNSGRLGSSSGSTNTSGSYNTYGGYEHLEQGTENLLQNDAATLATGVFGISVLIFLVLILMVLLVRFVIGGAVTLGYVKINLGLIDRKDVKFADLFSQFHRFGPAFLMQLLRYIFIFLWSLLLIIPGIIATYRYAMAPYILYENPDMSASDAIAESKELMQGNKWRLFCLNFSFIGWAILTIFTLGIGYLWLKPYQETAYAAFYREIKAEKSGTANTYDNASFVQ